MDVWQIGVKISLANEMSPVLAMIAKDTLALKGPISEVERMFSGWKPALAGAAMALTGGVIFGGLMKLADASTDLLDQQDKLQRSGIAWNDILKSQAHFYNDIAKSIPTASGDEWLKTINEMQSVVGLDKAELVASFALKSDAIISNALGKAVTGAGFSLYRALETRGTTMSDWEGSQKLGEAFIQDIIGSGGKLTADTFQAMAKRGGVAWMKASPEFLAGAGAVVAADLGGDTAGTALMSLYQTISGAGTMSKQQFGAFKDLGLLDLSKITVDKGGRVNAAPGAIKGYDVAMSDPQQWAQKFLEPALVAVSHGNTALADTYLAKIGRNRNTTRMLQMFTDPGFQEQFAKDAALWKRASGVDKAYDDAITRNPNFVQGGFDKQWKSMMEAIGAPLMQAAIPVMKEMTSLFTYIGQVANAHPAAIKLVGEALAALGVGLVAIGTVAILLTVGAMVSLTGAVAALAIAAGAFIAYNWDAIVKWTKEAWQAITDFGKAIAGLAIEKWQQVAQYVRDITAAIGHLAAVQWQKITDLFDGIYNAIAGFINKLSGIWNSIKGLGSWIGSGGGLLNKSSFVPPSGAGQPTVIHTALNIDGRTLARAVSTHIARNSPWSNGSSTFDGAAMAAPTDLTFT